MAKYSELVIDNVVGDVWDKEAIHNADLADIILNTIYPVGSIYFSADADFDPNEAWGGTWDKVEAGRVIVSAGTGYALGAKGGAATHKLTAPECALPSHSHNYYKVNATSGGTAISIAQMPLHDHGSKSLVGHLNFRRWVSDGHLVTGASGIAARSISSSKAYSTASYGTTAQPGLDIVTIDASHKHNPQGGGAAHTHSLGSTSTASTAVAQAASDSISLMQPYVAYNMWKRIA